MPALQIAILERPPRQAQQQVKDIWVSKHQGGYLVRISGRPSPIKFDTYHEADRAAGSLFARYPGEYRLRKSVDWAKVAFWLGALAFSAIILALVFGPLWHRIFGR